MATAKKSMTHAEAIQRAARLELALPAYVRKGDPTQYTEGALFSRLIDLAGEELRGERAQLAEGLEAMAPYLAQQTVSGDASEKEVRKFAFETLVLYASETAARASTYRFRTAREVFAFMATPDQRELPDSFALLATGDASLGKLAEVFREAVAALIDRIVAAEASAADTDMHPWDAALADVLASLGPARAAAAEAVRTKARDRWASRTEHPARRLWDRWLYDVPPEMPEPATLVDPPDVTPRALRSLARALWRDIVGPQLERERRKPPALVRAVAMPLLGLLGRARSEWEPDGQRVIMLPGEVPVAVEVESMVAALRSRASNGLKLFSSVVAHRVLRWQIETAHRQAREGNPDPRVIRLERGQRELAHDILGFTKKDAPEDVLSFLCAEDATRVPIEGHAPQRLIILEYKEGKGRRPACINHIVGSLILPDYVHELQKRLGPGLNTTIASRLVPIPKEAPLVGSPRAHAAQLTFQLYLVAHFVDHSRLLAEQGGVELPKAVLAELAARAGLTPELWPQVIDRWLQDGSDGPAFLKRGPEKGLLTLGDAHAVERAFIVDAGEHRAASSRRAQARGTRKRGLVTKRKLS